MDGATIDVDYSREAYTRRYRERLRHQKEKQLESTKVWVLSLPQHRLDLRCHSIASVKVDEFFHSTLYFQWCVRRFKKSLAGSLPEDQDGAEWERMVFEYMMGASERKPFEMYNLTDLQILTDAKEVFGVINDSLAFPVMKPNGMLEFGMVTHNPEEELEAGRSGNAMSCWAHRINRDPDTIFETCRNEGLQLPSMPKKGAMKMNEPVEEGMLTDESESNPPPPIITDDSSATPTATIGVPLTAASASEEVKPMIESESELTSSTKDSDILKQIGKIIAGKVSSEEGKEEIGGATPSTSEAASVSALNDTEKGMSYKDVCSEISAAIDFGAPAYNKGDHKGCYERYRAAGEKILKNCSLKGVQQEFRSAIELADKQPSFTKQAWTMRHAFDAILCGDIDTSDFTDSDKEELAKSTGAEDDDPAEMGYKEACLEISAAISRGAPTYNEGDHSGCYNIYRQAAEKIVERCSVAVVQQKLRLALYLAEKQPSFTDRAWTMRHSFDAILRGIFVILNGGVGNDEEGGEEGAAADGEGGVPNEEGEKGMSYEEACEEISAAISRGGPLYNEGDHEGCYNTYKQVAEKILEECTVAGVKRELRSALETVSKQASATMRAWTLRHAFDAILRGNIDRDRGGSVRVRRGDGPNLSFGELLERRGTL